MRKILVILVAALLWYFMMGKKSAELTEASVREFIDKADEAARKRWPDEICALRSKDFVLISHVEDKDGGFIRPSKKINKREFCKAIRTLPMLHNYRLTRESLAIQLSLDGQSAEVKAHYSERTPDYEGALPVEIGKAPDNYDIVQEVESDDVSVVVLEDGKLRIKSTESHSIHSRNAREK